VAGFFSNNLLSLDPDSGAIDLYPFAFEAAVNPIYGRGPFLMDLAADGKLYVGLYGSGRLAVIDTTTAPASASCKTLNGANQNPCIAEYDVQGAFVAQFGQQYPGVSFAPTAVFVDETNGVVWFGGGGSAFGVAPLSGYLEIASGEIHFLPPIQDPVVRRPPDPTDIFPERDLQLQPAANGVDLWGTDYIGRRLYLLKKLAG
jgi:hypothetical protein